VCQCKSCIQQSWSYLHVASSMNYIISVFLFYVHTDALQYEDMGQQTNAPTFKYLQHKKPNWFDNTLMLIWWPCIHRLIGMIWVPPLGQHHLAEVFPMLPATPQTYCQLQCQYKINYASVEMNKFISRWKYSTDLPLKETSRRKPLE
jgi:hypothetical protein